MAISNSVIKMIKDAFFPDAALFFLMLLCMIAKIAAWLILAPSPEVPKPRMRPKKVNRCQISRFVRPCQAAPIEIARKHRINVREELINKVTRKSLGLIDS